MSNRFDRIPKAYWPYLGVGFSSLSDDLSVLEQAAGAGGDAPTKVQLGFPPEPLDANPGAVKRVLVSANSDTLPAQWNTGDRHELSEQANPGDFIGGGGVVKTNTDSSVFFGNPVLTTGPNRAGMTSQCIVRFLTNSSWCLVSGFSAPSGVWDGRVFLRVDGRPVWTMPREFPGDYDGHESGMYIEFPDIRTRTVEVITGWLPGSVNTEEGATFAAAPTDRKRLWIMGDSWTDGTTQGGPWVSWARYLQSVSPWDVSVQGIGGTGYVAGGSDPWTAPFTAEARVNAITEFDPDLVLIVGSVNDGGDPGVRAAADSILDRITDGTPASTKIALIGAQIDYANNVQSDVQIAAAARGRARVIGVLSPTAAGWDVEGVRGAQGTTLNDPVHPTPVGVQWWGRRVEQWVRQITSEAGDPTW